MFTVIRKYALQIAGFQQCMHQDENEHVSFDVCEFRFRERYIRFVQKQKITDITETTREIFFNKNKKRAFYLLSFIGTISQNCNFYRFLFLDFFWHCGNEGWFKNQDSHAH